MMYGRQPGIPKSFFNPTADREIKLDRGQTIAFRCHDDFRTRVELEAQKQSRIHQADVTVRGSEGQSLYVLRYLSPTSTVVSKEATKHASAKNR